MGSFDRGLGREDVGINANLESQEKPIWKVKWVVEKYNGKKHPDNLYEVVETRGNLLLNEGINELWKLVANLTATPFDNANAYIGVGDSNTAEDASQTGLQGINKTYRPMDAGYPEVDGQTIIFQATFGENDANYDWYEFTIINGSDDTAVNLNRKVQDSGRKAQGTIWVLRAFITLS